MGPLYKLLRWNQSPPTGYTMLAMTTRTLTCLCLLAALAAPAPAQMDQERKYFYEDIFEPFFTKDEKAGEYRATRPGASGEVFPLKKKTGTFRAFVIGGSIAQKYMSGPDSLEQALTEGLPDMRIETLNCGMGGYDSFREAMVLEEVLQYSPDLIVLMSGHNEMVGSPPVPLWILHAQDRLSKVAAYRALVERLRPGPQKFGRTRENRGRDRAFRENLEQMVKHASVAGAPILLVVPPLNYRDAPGGVPLESSGFLEGWMLHLTRDYQGAIRRWTVLRGEGEKSNGPAAQATALFFMGRAHEAMGQPDAASASYREALRVAHPFSGDRCDPVCQDMIRHVAQAGGALLADLDSAFRRAAGPRVPGFEMFEDSVHWHNSRNRLVSWEIVNAVRSSSSFKPLPWSEGGLAGLKRAASTPDRADADEALMTLRYALSEMGIADDRLSRRAVVYLDAVFQRQPKWFDDIPAMLRRATMENSAKGLAWGMPSLNTSIHLLRWHAGEMWLERGDYSRAAAELEEASRQIHGDRGLRGDLALALALSGQVSRAREMATDQNSSILPEQRQIVLKIVDRE